MNTAIKCLLSFLVAAVFFWGGGTLAFVYARPLFVMRTVEYRMLASGPANQFFHYKKLIAPETEGLLEPNPDMLYSFAWLDLGNGPLVLHVPETGDRYYSFEMIDMWTDVFAYVGRRATGNSEEDFVIVGPGWTGNIPSGLKRINSPTQKVWVIGRTFVEDRKDLDNAVALMNQYTLVPLMQNKG